jgi:uncharacterized membrane protein YhfC
MRIVEMRHEDHIDCVVFVFGHSGLFVCVGCNVQLSFIMLVIPDLSVKIKIGSRVSPKEAVGVRLLDFGGTGS